MYSVTHQRCLVVFIAAVVMYFEPAAKVRADAIDLPAATVSLLAAANSPNETFNGPLTSSGPPCSGALSSCGLSLTYSNGYATAVASGFPAPAVLAEDRGNSIASSSLTYYFEISGPANTIVPITFIGAFTLEGAVSDFDSENVFVNNVATGEQVLGFSPVCCGLSTGPFAVDTGVMSDVLYSVNLGAAAQFDFDPSGAVLEIDPTIISISPAFADQFQLILSPGIGNSVPAPLIGRGLPVLLAVGGMLFGAKLLERGKRRRET